MFANDSSHRSSDVLLDSSDEYGSFAYNQSNNHSFRDSMRRKFQIHRKKFLFIGVFLVLAFTVGVAIIITRPDDDNTPNPPEDDCTCMHNPPPKGNGKPFALEQLFSNQLSISFSTLSWSTADDCLIERTRAGDIVKYVIDQSGNQTVKLVDNQLISKFSGSYWYSNDYTHWLFRTNYQSLYRHSGVGQYWLLSTDQPTNQPAQFPDPNTPMKLQYAAFSPSVTLPSAAYVYENNIYLYNLSIARSAINPVQVTTDGSSDILNGVLDWAYEEEVFSQTQSIWWNEQSTFFIYLSINQSMVPSYKFPLYDFPVNQDYTYKYPLVDQTVSIAQVGFYRVGDAQGQLINGLIELSNDQSNDQPIYVIDVVWLTETKVAIKLMPRLQTTYQVYSVDLISQTIEQSNDGSVDQLFHNHPNEHVQLSVNPSINKLHSASDPYYIDTSFFMRPLPSINQTNNQYIDIGSINDRQHIALYHADGTLDRWLTSSPDWSVMNIHCFYQSNNQSNASDLYLYFTANYPTSIDRTLHWLNVRTGEQSIMVDWTNEPSSDQSIDQVSTSSNVWQSASFSKHCTHFKLSEESSSLKVNLYSINQANPSTATFIKTLKDNDAVKRTIEQSMDQSNNQWALPSIIQSTFPSTVVPGAKLNSYWMLPPTYKGHVDQSIKQSIDETDLFANPDCSYKYPLVLYPYGGPGSSQVNSRFKLGGNGGTSFSTFLSSSLGMIVLVVDPVGTGQQTNSFQKNYTTLRLGINEQVDFWGVLNTVKDLCFVDSERIAFWGHSYGGYMATRMAMSQSNNQAISHEAHSINPFIKQSIKQSTFRLNTVIAGAPVTDWRLYDAIYTERYMRRSIDNEQGYQETSTIFQSITQQLPCRQFYVLHGTADDNVHYQNAALLAQNLTRNSAQFHQFAFVNRNHGFNPFNGWGQASNHTFTAMHYYVMLTNIFENMIVQPIPKDQTIKQSNSLLSNQFTFPSSTYSMDSFESKMEYNLDELDRLYQMMDEETKKERMGEREKM